MGCRMWSAGRRVCGVRCRVRGVGCEVQGVGFGADPCAERCKHEVVDVISPRGPRENLPK